MPPDQYELRWPRVGPVIAVAVVAGFLVWLLAIRDDDEAGSDASPQAGAVESFGPEFVGPARLREAAGTLGHPVYWAGQNREGEIELTVTADGRAFVRYITGGANPGVEQADFLTVATYQLADAEGATREAADRPGRESFDLPDGGLAVFHPEDPGRVYFNEAGSDLQVEVFDPAPGQAVRLVDTGRIEPIS